MSLNIAAGLGLGGNKSYPDLFQPYGGPQTAWRYNAVISRCRSCLESASRANQIFIAR